MSVVSACLFSILSIKSPRIFTIDHYNYPQYSQKKFDNSILTDIAKERPKVAKLIARCTFLAILLCFVSMIFIWKNLWVSTLLIFACLPLIFLGVNVFAVNYRYTMLQEKHFDFITVIDEASFRKVIRRRIGQNLSITLSFLLPAILLALAQHNIFF